MRCVVIVNDEALGARGAAVEEALREAGVSAEVRRVPAAACPGAARGAAADARVDLVVAAGGDGTVNAVAAVLAGSEKPLGVLPLGTLNHFAKDLGIPLVLADAARLLLVASPRRVDVAEVNGRVFVSRGARLHLTLLALSHAPSALSSSPIASRSVLPAE